MIELDDGQHSERPEDKQRDSKLCALGYRVIRIWNNEIIDTTGFSKRCCVNSKNRPSPRPSPRKRPQAGRGRVPGTSFAGRLSVGQARLAQQFQIQLKAAAAQP